MNEQASALDRAHAELRRAIAAATEIVALDETGNELGRLPIVKRWPDGVPGPDVFRFADIKRPTEEARFRFVDSAGDMVMDFTPVPPLTASVGMTMEISFTGVTALGHP